MAIPDHADERGEGGQPWIQAHHIGQEDGVEDLAEGVESRHSPIAGSVDDLGQARNALCLLLHRRPPKRITDFHG